MSSVPKAPIGQQYAALMRLHTIVEQKGRKLLPSTAATGDLEYIVTGLAGAIDTILYVREHRDAIVAAVAAAKSKREPVT